MPPSTSSRRDEAGFFPDLDPAFVKENYFMGFEPTVDGKPLSDNFWNHWIMTSVKHIEREAQIAIAKKRILGEPHDYHIGDYHSYNFLQLFHRPIISVEGLAGIHPSGAQPYTFPREWFKVHQEGGQLQMHPVPGSTAAMAMFGSSSLPMLFGGSTYLPGFFKVDYTAGFETGKIPEDVIDVVCKRVAIDVFAQLGDLIYSPGVTSMSTSIDGVSSSMSIVNNGQLGAVFTSRIGQYRKDLFGDPQAGDIGMIKRLKHYYHGINYVSL